MFKICLCKYQIVYDDVLYNCTKVIVSLFTGSKKQRLMEDSNLENEYSDQDLTHQRIINTSREFYYKNYKNVSFFCLFIFGFWIAKFELLTKYLFLWTEKICSAKHLFPLFLFVIILSQFEFLTLNIIL